MHQFMKFVAILGCAGPFACAQDRPASSPDNEDNLSLLPASNPNGSRRPITPEVNPDDPLSVDVLSATDPKTPLVQAKGTFLSAPKYKVSGSVSLRETNTGVNIQVEVSGAPPGRKGIHIHQTTDCSDIPNKSMGAHFAPQHGSHGLPEDQERHLGDLGNIQIDADGTGKLEITVAGANLQAGGELSFVERSVVVHEAADHGAGESGGSGKPIACAPIQKLGGRAGG